jgi:hypothetical protein
LLLTDIFIATPHITGRIGDNPTCLLHLFDLKRWTFILSYFYETAFIPTSYWGQSWGGVWAVLVVGFVIAWNAALDDRAKFMRFFLVGFCAVFFFLYLITDHNLVWKVGTTWWRELYQIMPLAVLYIFYRIFANEG